MNGINGMNRNTPEQNKNWGENDLYDNGMKSGGKGLLEERSGLSVDDFLKIMAAEMQNQSPMGDSGGGGGGSKTDYVSQLAQFTSLELMSDVVEGLNYVNVMSQQQHAFSLIGKEVSLKIPEIDEDGKFKTDKDGKIIMKTIEGTVEKIRFKNGLPLASVRDGDGKLEDYDLGYIMAVGAEGKIVVSEDTENKDNDNDAGNKDENTTVGP